MADQETPQPASEDAENQEGISLESGADTSPATASETPAGGAKSPKKGGIKALFRRFSLYLLLFVLVIVVAVMVVVIAYLKNNTKSTNKISSQSLSQSSTNQLAQSSVSVGDAQQTLNIQSNAVFTGQVLVRQDLQVAGKIQVGGNLAANNLSVTNDSQLAQVEVSKNLAVTGNAAIQGQLTTQGNLSVNGTGTFNGQLSAPQIAATTLQLNGDLNLTHHIAAGGVAPGRTPGNALGSGGTASVSGSDTAGYVAISTGNNAVTGCFVTINFSTKFNTAPYVVLTPVEAGAASISYYVTRTTGGFTICTASQPPSAANFGYDYIAFD